MSGDPLVGSRWGRVAPAAFVATVVTQGADVQSMFGWDLRLGQHVRPDGDRRPWHGRHGRLASQKSRRLHNELVDHAERLECGNVSSELG